MYKSTRFTHKLIGSVLLCAIAITGLPLFKVSAAGTITGRVFQDFNGNGIYDTAGSAALPAIDSGLVGVTVTAYDSAGVSRGVATTLAAGTYSLSATETGPYRIEFTNLPTGYTPSARSTDSVLGGAATDSGSAVQFLADGNSSNVNLALNNPNDYSQNNPTIIEPMFRNTTTTAYAGTAAVMGFPLANVGDVDGNINGTTTTGAYGSPATPPTYSPATPVPNSIFTDTQVGAVWGAAWNRNTKDLFVSSYIKANVKLGPGESTGRIWKTNNPTSGSTPTSFVDLNTVFPGSTGANPHPRTTTSWITDTPTTIANIGKLGIGDIDLSNDGSTLYAVNLADRRLYAIPTTGTIDSTTVKRYDVPTASLPTQTTGGAASTCPAADVRPFGLGSDRDGNLYVGAVCSGETNSTGVDADPATNPGTFNLRAYVWKVAITSGVATFTLVFNNTLRFDRDSNGTTIYDIRETPTQSYDWEPWTSLNSTDLDGEHNQPMLTDITVEGSSMYLGFRDRFGDQDTDGGYRSSGDSYLACLIGATYTLESNGVCDTLTSTNGVGGGKGPGGGEFFSPDTQGDDIYHSGNGGLGKMPGGSLYQSSTDGVAYSSSTFATRIINPGAGGIQRFSPTTGLLQGAYDVYNTSTANTMQKASGLGDIELLVDAAPIEVGNRVWNDANGNGVQNAGEAAIANVDVELWADTNADGIVDVRVGQARTDASGEYYFVGSTTADPTVTDNLGQVNGGILPNTAYQVRVLSSEFGAGQPLVGLFPTNDNADGSANGDARDSDGSVIAGGHVAVNFNTGAAGNNSHLYDFGFSPTSTYSIGNRVWYDTNNNGQVDAVEVGISGVSVSLFADTGCDGTPNGAALQTLSTDSSGYYRFDGLAAGCFIVRVNPSNFVDGGLLSAYVNTSGNVTTDTDSTTTAAGENGIDPASYFGNNAASPRVVGISTNSITLGPGSTEPTAETDISGSGAFQGQGSFDNQADMTIDLGFYEMCLCGTIWSDNGTGGGVNNNGIQDGGELGIPSVRVRVYTSAGVEIPVGDDGILGTADDANGGVLTDSTGKYRFVGLEPGDYRIAISSGNSSTPTNSTPNFNVDLDDNGFNNPTAIGSIPAGWVVSHPLTMTPGGEPLINNADGTTANVTLDMGLIAAPTAVKMDTFDVLSDGNSTVVTWETGSETNNLGFNVYREVDGKRELLTKSPIAGSALRGSARMEATGDSYQFMVKDSPKGATYFVEDLDLSGDSTFHGSSEARVADLSKFGSASRRTMADLTESSESSESVESIESVVSTKKSRAATATATALAAATVSATRGGVKFHVKRDGWYRVSAATLVSNGFSGDAANWNLLRNGVEVPMRVSPEGSVEFYGQGVDLATTNTQVYYLANSDSAGKRLSVSPSTAEDSSVAATSFASTVERKDRTLYLSFLLNGEKENWFGPMITPSALTNQSLTLNNPANADFANVKVRLQGLTNTPHAVRVLLNNTEIGTVSYNGYENKVAEFNVPATQIVNGANQVSLQSVASNDYSVVDSVKISFQREFKAVNNFLRFSANANQAVKFGGFTTGFEVFEVVDGVVSEQIVPNNADTKNDFIISAANRNREFIALSSDQSLSPELVEVNNPSTLSSKKNIANFVIIAPDSLKAKAQALAAVRTSQGILTKVVSVEDIYDEFSFGSHDPKAIKDFLKFATSRWNVRPSFALFFGDSSSDSKGYTGVSNDLVPTKLIDTVYLETSSDTWLADFNDDNLEDIAIGRLPVANNAEADVVLAKLARYDAQTVRSEFKNLVITDKFFDSYANAILTSVPASMPTTRVDRGVLSDSAMRQAITDNLNANPFIVTYYGHGSVSTWTDGSVLRVSDAQNLNNNQLGLYLLMTCLNGYSHAQTGDGMAEGLFKANNGGSIAVWASSGMTIADYTTAMTQSIYSQITNPIVKNQRLGQILKAAKAASNDPDVRKTWSLIGDPTIFVK